MNREVVLITGGAKGIGKSIAYAMARKNYNIVINYLNSEINAKEIKADIESKYNVEVFLIKGDVSKEEMVKDMINTIIEKFERIDCLVNNAAVCQDNYYSDKSAKEFMDVVSVDLIGPFITSKYVGSYMYEQKKGKIINISSTNGIDTNEVYSMDYDASKAGLISLTHNFAKALAPFVRVNAVAPGWTKTEAVMEMNPNYLKEEEQKIMLERFAEPEEIANVVAFLASDEASYINGTVIRVDGGLK